ncbi:MAG: hypothetical protein KDH96_04535 [Candidatus Riesia sp.]|nr:hypothetical protein [Candidatus Riesia sp.]
MPTNKEIVSRVKNTLNLVNKDMDVNGRFILHTAQNISISYISKRLRSRSLYRQDNLFTTVPCVELIDIDVFSCDIVEFKSCKKLKRSKKKLPELIYSRYGSSLKEVTAIDGLYEFKPSTLSQYRRDSQRAGFSDYKYFYVKNGYLWIPDSEQELVELYLLTPDLYDLYEMSECQDDCKSAWDYEFIVPSDLLEQVISETAQKISIRYQIPTDENPNLDSNQKTQTA